MSGKSKSTAFLLCYFLGLIGAHRFYLKRWISAVLMLLTLGGLGIWWLIDTVLIMGGKFNDVEGNPLRTGPPDADNPHAGFWVRLAAISVDMVIVQLVVMVLAFVGSIALGLGAIGSLDLEDPAAIQQVGAAATALTSVLFLIVAPLYFGLQTASSLRATVGKRVFDIEVCSSAGERLNLLRSLWRAVCYFLSALPLALGFVLAAFSKDKRALHDYLAGSKVLYVGQEANDASPRAEKPRAVNATVMRSSDAPDASGADSSAKIIVVLGAVLLAGAAALALL